MQRRLITRQILTAASCLLPMNLFAGPTASAAAAWGKYVASIEAGIERDFLTKDGFLNIDLREPGRAHDIRRKLKAGGVHIQKAGKHNSNVRLDVDGGMIHHWLGAIFVPNATLNQVLEWVQNYNEHQRHFKEVERSQLIKRSGETFEIYLRLARTKIVTVRYDTNHHATYRRHDAARASSRSVATRIVEIADEPGKDHGFLWRLNSYWRFSEEHDGVFVECESLSLSRSIPFGLGWLVERYVDSVPRESLEETLTAIKRGLVGASDDMKETRR